MERSIKYADGKVLAFAEYGDRAGVPILVQHGLIASVEDSDLFDLLLRNNGRLICIARPGYGASSPSLLNSYAEWADLVYIVAEELNLTRFDVLGISSGAPYSYSIGARFPDKVRNIYILSGMPALYDDQVLSLWPYPLEKGKTIAEMSTLARSLFFLNLTPEDLLNKDISDSMMNDCFGVAQDLKLRTLPWGFALSDIKAPVFMRHSRGDDSVPFQTAVRTAQLLPRCTLELTEQDPHFSKEVLEEFIQKTILKNLHIF